MKRVIGIGNALTDMLVNLKTDKVLDTFNLPKGSMSLVDAALQTEISKSVAGLPYSLSLGGSAGNTIRAMARLGCDVGFIGKVGTDKTGDFFIQALENLGIEPFIFRGKERSGRCVSLISPDGERTMVTFLGAALELSAAEVTSAIFEGYDCLYRPTWNFCARSFRITSISFLPTRTKRKPSPARASRSMPCRCFRSCASWPS